MKIAKKILKKLVLIGIGLLIFWMILMFVYSLYYKVFGLYKTEYIFKTKNTYVFIAKDDIMSPIVKKNDIVVIKRIKQINNLQEKDIVYIKENNQNKLARIEKIRKDEEGKKYYTTKGIKNYYYNPQDIYAENLIGKLEKAYTGLSLSFKIGTSNEFTVFVIIILLAILYLMIKNDKRRRNRRRKSEKSQKET